MPILAAMRQRKARRIAEAARRAVNDFSDERQRAHSSGADTGRQQQIGEVDRASFRRCGQIAVQSPQMNVAARTS